MSEDRIEQLAKAVAKVYGEAIVAPKPPQMGERKLARQLVEDAMREANGLPSNTRDDARAWLRDELRMMSARTCFEAIGIDYDAAMAKLEEKWREAF